jgi:uncharacterized protein (TIGR01244 family)
MGLGRFFLLSIAAGAAGVMALAAWTAEPAPPRSPHAGLNRPLIGNVTLRDQIALRDIAGVKSQGFRLLVDLRPDGEDPDQPPSRAVADEARKAGLAFSYIPTPHGAEPEATVERLAHVLAGAEGPVLLYCRSGNRAARVWALAEASRVNGAMAGEITAAARRVGHPVDDLLPRIEARIALRGKS